MCCIGIVDGRSWKSTARHYRALTSRNASSQSRSRPGSGVLLPTAVSNSSHFGASVRNSSPSWRCTTHRPFRSKVRRYSDPRRGQDGRLPVHRGLVPRGPDAHLGIAKDAPHGRPVETLSTLPARRYAGDSRAVGPEPAAFRWLARRERVPQPAAGPQAILSTYAPPMVPLLSAKKTTRQKPLGFPRGFEWSGKRDLKGFDGG